MDDFLLQNTWFDLGQTSESFYTFQPQQSDRAAKIRLISIERNEGIVAEAELIHEPQKCKSSSSSKPVNSVETSFTLPHPTQQVDRPEGSNTNTILIATSSVLMSIFLLAIAVVLVVKRAEICFAIKMSRRKNEEVQLEEDVTMDRDQNNRFRYYLNQLDEEDSNSLKVFKNGLNDNLTFFV